MFARLSRGQRRTALVIASLVSLAAMGACANSATGPDRLEPPNGLRARQRAIAPITPPEGDSVALSEIVVMKQIDATSATIYTNAAAR